MKSRDGDGLCDNVDFDCSGCEERLACIFMRPREGTDLSSSKCVRPGDAVRVQTQGAGGSRDWFPAWFKVYMDNGCCSIFFWREGSNQRSNKTGAPTPPCLEWALDSRDSDQPSTVDKICPDKEAPQERHRFGVVTGIYGRGTYALEWDDESRIPRFRARGILRRICWRLFSLLVSVRCRPTLAISKRAGTLVVPAVEKGRVEAVAQRQDSW